MFVGFIFLAAAPLLMSDSVSSRCLASVKTSAVICLIDFFPALISTGRLPAAVRPDQS